MVCKCLFNKDDNLLLKSIEDDNSKSWVNIAINFNNNSIVKRTYIQCKNRYLQFLNVKSNNIWSKNEVKLLILKQLEYGNVWEIISKYFYKKNKTEIKNKFNKILYTTLKDFNNIYGSIILEKLIKGLNLKYIKKLYLFFNQKINNNSLSEKEKINLEHSKFFNEIVYQVHCNITDNEINIWNFKKKFKKLIIFMYKSQNYWYKFIDNSEINFVKKIENSSENKKFQYNQISNFIDSLTVSDFINLNIFNNLLYSKYINDIKLNFLNLKKQYIQDIINSKIK